MLQLFTFLLLAAAAVQTYASAAVSGRIEAPAGERLTVSPNNVALLDRGIAGTTLVRRDGTFSFNDVSAGSYVLSIHAKDWTFPEVTVTVNDQDGVVARLHRAGQLPGRSLPPMPYPLVIAATGAPQYRDPQKEFSIQKLVMANPTFLLMGVGGLLVFLMPKLLAQMDPEALKEAQEGQAELHKSIGDLASGGGFAKLLSGDSGDSQQSQSKPQARKNR